MGFPSRVPTFSDRQNSMIFPWFFQVFSVNFQVYFDYFYRPQRSWGKVIFSEACVNNSVHRGACVVAQGGMRGCTGGWGCVWFYLGGHVWFYLGGMHGFIQGGHAWIFQFFRIQWDTVNERAVCILLECILVEVWFPSGFENKYANLLSFIWTKN